MQGTGRAFGGDVKGGGGAARAVEPVDRALAVRVLVVLGHAIAVGQGVPVLAHLHIGGELESLIPEPWLYLAVLGRAVGVGQRVPVLAHLHQGRPCGTCTFQCSRDATPLLRS